MLEENRVGSKIRQLREAKEMTIEELAEASQSSAELIRQLEDGALIPSLTPLIKIARALGVRLGTFLDDMPQSGPVIVRAGRSEKVVRFSGKTEKPKESALEFYSLASDKADRHMEPFIIDIHPSPNESHPLSSHEGEEFIYVLSGEIEIFYGKDVQRLSAGDSIYYDSIVPHDVHAAGEGDAKILAVIYAPL
ncbi:transcriptional regulator, XRE family with cupin sensor [Methanosarcina thermophila]|jgi:transcriptional regulator with XRE-family HTH domain|uniref:Transcriptional regulator, MerR family n=3 Tax=Methanosarcina thermophila TaxID=2210 RepID=A0A1I6Y2G6_METTE|nr:XRE family transcriptional regulator [Methanosarcina thermophila]ALK05823.1 MAG: DNA-binding protein [Methanosarcina sp. 795]AKB12695.1 Transcriptional regulator, MerR family [Methanosarcina thermophila TM-1]AKB16687.1 Transcriptional regulator, MerR family [Methanosarcina thermophila CHTI-55]NLU57696.1 helix-turn-helix domain-containing protein [Methanosarcina thermophila]SFT44304.1 transcriptional regulator, XRE family with cupin sensor [Methanosarcina thermophila]